MANKIPLEVFPRGYGFDLVTGEFFEVKMSDIVFKKEAVTQMYPGMTIAFVPYFMNFIAFPISEKAEMAERLGNVLEEYISWGIAGKDPLLKQIKDTLRGHIFNSSTGTREEAGPQLLKISEKRKAELKTEGKRMLVIFPQGLFLLTKYFADANESKANLDEISEYISSHEPQLLGQYRKCGSSEQAYECKEGENCRVETGECMRDNYYVEEDTSRGRKNRKLKVGKMTFVGSPEEIAKLEEVLHPSKPSVAEVEEASGAMREASEEKKEGKEEMSSVVGEVGEIGEKSEDELKALLTKCLLSE
jgi:hypothetical protein